MRALLPRIAEALDTLFAEENVDILGAISGVRRALEFKDLGERVSAVAAQSAGAPKVKQSRRALGG